ncbi:UDP-glucose 4-epimerase GalE [Peptostreptococcus faecalis]|uniref:UDP-glucose 4-epimerase GalE n=1 Tax=Peptostreptococcus faecalis TaxID=2045015 RepID=UPI000C7CD5B9|nr:UDP-glucose 4-epimerase GalE [Peptostreptococcus faecalis]
MYNILLAGGAGYIGSHTAVELIKNGYNVIIVDNFSNSYPTSIKRIEQITSVSPVFYELDTRDDDFEKVFKENKIDAVIDFAAYKSVGDSVKKPLEYYDNNLFSLLNTLKLMKKYNVNNFVFSSTASVYGNVEEKNLPVKEDHIRKTTNPYGNTKIMGEHIIEDLYNSDKKFNSIILRYFNPIGAHKSGLIGEESTDIPANIMPYLTKVAIGELPYLNVYGNDYDTVDGTGVRDYIHVVDLAKGHLKAIDRLLNNKVGVEYFNLGTGRGYSVMELIESFSKACGKSIPYKITDRRAGDAAVSYADVSKANTILNWYAEHSIVEMCSDSWRWQEMNPKGYEK